MSGILSKLLHRSKDSQEFKARFKEAEMNAKIEKTLLERSKSSNRRELERYMHDQEEAEVKKALDKIHDKQNSENWKSNSMINSQKRILKNDKPILKEKNIFLNNKQIFLKRGKL